MPVGAFEEAVLEGDATIVLTLYVSGRTANSVRAIANLRSICERELAGRYELDVVDVTQEPEVAEEHKILATPALIKELPPPLRRIVGDLSDRDRVLLGLDLSPEHRSGESSKGNEE